VTFALALRELWSRKLLLAFGVPLAILAAVASVSNVSLLPPGKSEGTLEYFSARTQILVDSKDSSIADLHRDMTPMVARANVYSRFLTTPAALRVIGQNAHVPPADIYAEGPYQLGQARFIQEPTAEKRGSQLVGRKARYRLRFDSDPELPIVTVYAEAPSGRAATMLAEGASTGLADYVTKLQDQQGIAERRRVDIRQLGSTIGSPVTAGAGSKVAVFVFIVVFGLWCLTLLMVRRLIKGWKQAGQAEELEKSELLARSPLVDPDEEPEPARAELGGDAEDDSEEREPEPERTTVSGKGKRARASARARQNADSEDREPEPGDEPIADEHRERELSRAG
jgi:hypothetical protein